MSLPNILRRFPASCSLAAFVGIAGAVLSLSLAWLMWQRGGNPAFLLIWLASAMAVATYARFHRRWTASFERLASQTASATPFNLLRQWDGQATDVAFTEASETPSATA
ncbi:MAG TPA: hypothetical protein VGE12_01425 [Noviherbaspirillum sp.]